MAEDKSSAAKTAFNTAVVAGKIAAGVAAAHHGTAADVDHLQKSYGDKSKAEAMQSAEENKKG